MKLDWWLLTLGQLPTLWKQTVDNAKTSFLIPFRLRKNMAASKARYQQLSQRYQQYDAWVNPTAPQGQGDRLNIKR